MRRTAPTAYLRQRFRRRIALACMVLLLIGLGVAADRAGLLWHQAQGDFARFDGRTFELDRVAPDGTLRVGAGEASLRLLGIQWEPLAYESARAFEGAPVTLWLRAPHTRDAQGRLLASVELADGRDLATHLLGKGAARYDGRWLDAADTRWLQAEAQARGRGAGCWAPIEENHGPGG